MSCAELVSSNLLQPTTLLGVVGLTVILALVVTALITLLSLCLCVAARR